MTVAQESTGRLGHEPRRFDWPHKVDLFGVAYTPTTYQEAAESIIAAARQRVSAVVACHAVHAVITASCDPLLRDKVNSFDMVTPDGQPVRWALNLLHDSRLSDRVYGPDLMQQLCSSAADADVSIYLYGGSPAVVEQLTERLSRQYPNLRIAGYESPPYRHLTAAEDAEVVARINASGAGIVFIGLGCPKQDHFAYDHREKIRAVQVCVGAAFDFHAGAKSMAPVWMQRRGLEWVHRLMQEPGRLWRRYLVTNTVFVVKLALASLHWRRVRQQRQQWRLLKERA